MKRTLVLTAPRDRLLPGFAFKNDTRGNGLTDPLGTLVEDATGTHGVVPHLAVAHVFVCWHADGLPVGA